MNVGMLASCSPGSWKSLRICVVALALGCSKPPEGAALSRSTVLAPATPEPPTLVVVGRGEATAKPDTGRITFAVMSKAPSMSFAFKQNKTQAAALIKAMRGAGIEERDIQTSQFNVYSNAGLYEVRNAVEVTVRDVDRVGDVVDAALAGGSNEIFGVRFDLDKKDTLEEELRTGAIKDAKQRAEALAKLSGKKLGAILGVSEILGMDAAFGRGQGRAAGVGAAPVPFESGELTFERQLQVTYAMKDDSAR